MPVGQQADRDAAFLGEVESILRGGHADPFHILGPHTIEIAGEKRLAIRAFLPRASEVTIVFDGGPAPCPSKLIHPDGFFEAIVPGAEGVRPAPGAYRLRIHAPDGATREIHDPYAFPPLLSDLDLHLIVDNYATHKHPKVRAWLERHPRFHFHFTPTSASWLNAVEGFFAKLTRQRLKRGVFKGIVDLQAAINRYLAETNDNPKPFTWTADPHAIIEKVRRGKQALESIH